MCTSHSSGQTLIPKERSGETGDSKPTAGPAVTHSIKWVLPGLLRPAKWPTRVRGEFRVNTRVPVLFIYSADRHFESTRDARINLRSGAIIEAQHPAEPLGAFDGARYGFGAVVLSKYSTPFCPFIRPTGIVTRQVTRKSIYAAARW